MATVNGQASSSGIGFFSLLGVLFIGLKLTHFIDWRWRWVLAPLWGPAAIALVVIAFFLTMWAIARAVK